MKCFMCGLNSNISYIRESSSMMIGVRIHRRCLRVLYCPLSLRWPQFYEEIKDLPIFPQVYPMCLEFILNREDEDPITTSSMQQQQFSSSSSSCSASLNKMNRKVATSPSTNTSSSSSSSPVQ